MKSDEEYNELLIDCGKYDYTLGAAAQRLQAALPIGNVKAVGHMEVPTAIDELIAERDAMREALKKCRKNLSGYGYTMRSVAAVCEISPTLLSQWTAEECGPPDIVCRRGDS